MTAVIPREDQFLFGDVMSSAVGIAVVRFKRVKPIRCRVLNTGPAAFTFSVLNSNDNGVGDAYAAVNVRYLGNNVASIVVQPGADVEFLIEQAANAKEYLQFQATPQPGSAGILTVYSRVEAGLTQVAQVGVGYNAPLGV